MVNARSLPNLPILSMLIRFVRRILWRKRRLSVIEDPAASCRECARLIGSWLSAGTKKPSTSKNAELKVPSCQSFDAVGAKINAPTEAGAQVSMGPIASNHHKKGLKQDHNIKPQRPMLDIMQIVLQPLSHRFCSPACHLLQARQAWLC